MRLRTHLVLLVLVSVAPLALFAGVLVWQDLAAEEDVRRSGTRDTVRALSLAIDRELRTSFSVLETLAASRSLAEGNLARFHQLCAGAVMGRKGVWVILFDPSGQQILNSSKPFGSPLPNPVRDSKPPGTDPRYPSLRVGGPELVTRVLRTGKPVVSDLFVALDSGEPKIGVAIPILQGGTVSYVLEMSVEPSALLQIFREQEVPSTWTASILDQRGMILSRSINAQATLGKPISAELAAQIAEAPEGEGVGRTLEGVRVYHTYARCRVAPWTVAVGASTERADARERQTLFLVGGGSLLALCLGLAVSWLMGRRISSSISSLSASADAMATGQGASPPVPAVKEVQELRRALIAAGERKRAQDEIARLNVDLDRRVRERTAELEAFTYTVAHDLRAPLRAMQGFSDLVLEDAGGRLEASERDYLKRIAQAAQRMDALVRDLLAYSRLGSVEVTPESVDLGALARDVVRGMEAELKARGAEVVVEEGIPHVLAQRPILFQVMANLMSNAAKFVPHGVDPRIRVHAGVLDGRVRLCVEDNGIGVDPQFREKLFGVFERLQAGDAYPGTGIGLAIVKRAVERMGGRVGVEPRNPRGSVFWFELPRAPGAPASVKEAADSSLAAPDGR
jgi:signal transduction histidine kinase